LPSPGPCGRRPEVKCMSYDLFLSYSRRDNGQGRITALKERLEVDHRAFVGAGGAELRVFFDREEIRGMDDWRHRILGALRESRLLLVCLSPAYLESEYCAWEFIEYLNHEFARALLGVGVAPVYFVDVPGWEDRDFETRCAEWVKELRRRHYFDLRPWFHEGESAPRRRRSGPHGPAQPPDPRPAGSDQQEPRGQGQCRSPQRAFPGSHDRASSPPRAGRPGQARRAHRRARPGGNGQDRAGDRVRYAFAHEYPAG